MLESEYHVHDVASWFDMPLADGTSITPATLHHLNRQDLVLDLAAGRADATAIVREVFPNLERERRFQVFEASDGMLSLRVRDD
jgi:hypothetical protein